MKRSIVLVLWSSMPVLLMAVPPSPFPMAVCVPNDTAWVVRVMDCSMPDYWISAVLWDKTSRVLSDSLVSLIALRTRPCTKEAMNGLPLAFYAVLRDHEGRLTYAVSDELGTLIPSSFFVGVDLPPAEMANQLLPDGAAYQRLQEWITWTHRDDRTTLDEYFGTKTIAFVPVRYQRAETDTSYRTFGLYRLEDDTAVVRMAARDWLRMMFGHNPPPPNSDHAPQDQTLEDWYLTATNSQVHFIPNTSRWNQYAPGCNGLICHVDSNGYAVPWQIPLTRNDLLAMSEFDVWDNVIQPLLQAEGADGALGDEDNIVCLVWMEDWSREQWSNTLWPRASSSFGWFQVGSNYGADVSGPGVFIHELAHAGPGLPDGYAADASGSMLCYDYFNPMSMGCHNFGGWRTPYFATP